MRSVSGVRRTWCVQQHDRNVHLRCWLGERRRRRVHRVCTRLLLGTVYRLPVHLQRHHRRCQRHLSGRTRRRRQLRVPDGRGSGVPMRSLPAGPLQGPSARLRRVPFLLPVLLRPVLDAVHLLLRQHSTRRRQLVSLLGWMHQLRPLLLDMQRWHAHPMHELQWHGRALQWDVWGGVSRRNVLARINSARRRL